METIRGKTSLDLDLNEFKKRLKNYNRITLDLGTGDGRYVRTLAGRNPNWFIVGVDACRENLHKHSRAKLPNMLFVIANARKLPSEFSGLFSDVTIHFPWESLLEFLLTGEPGLLNSLYAITRPEAQIEIYINGGALEEAGTSLEAGAEAIYENMNRYGWKLTRLCPLDDRSLRSVPTTWARRLAYGRDPCAVALSGRRAT